MGTIGRVGGVNLFKSLFGVGENTWFAAEDDSLIMSFGGLHKEHLAGSADYDSISNRTEERLEY